MDALEQRIERKGAVLRDNDFAVDDATIATERKNRVDQLRKIPRQRPASLRLEIDLPASRKAMQRKPSHFGSYCQYFPRGMSATDSASIGAKGGHNSNSGK
jgi:hypothetical protein